MDSARFGKALGIGARAAAKAVVSAADAATAQTPGKPVSGPSGPNRAPGAYRIPDPRRMASQVNATGKGVREGSRRFGRAVWAPAARLSGILWLEVTGVFFGLFASTGAMYCWHQRGVLEGGVSSARQSFWIMAAMTLIFGYFCVSSFVRARRRGRQ